VESGYQTTPVPRASRVSSIEEPIPQTQRPLSRFHNAFSNVRSRISTLVSGTINNHTRLDNDDTSTTTTRDELGYPSSNVGAGSASSFDGHSMTTVTSNQRSNHHLVTVEVEPSAPIEDTSVEVEDTSSLQSQRMDVGIPFISNPSCCTQSVLSHSSIETSNGPAN
jgi:hypothetical protein